MSERPGPGRLPHTHDQSEYLRNLAPVSKTPSPAVTDTSLHPDGSANTHPTNVTIIFGPKGSEERFDADRHLLRKNIEWFNRASENFSEAHKSELTLHGDDRDAVRAMLYWAHKNIYATQYLHAVMGLQRIEELFLRHLRVFVVADKYCAKGLDDRALKGIKQVVTDFIVDGRFMHKPSEILEFIRFVVEEIFVYQTCFHQPDDTDHTLSSSTAIDSTVPDIQDDAQGSTEDFFKMPATATAKNIEHPIDRIQKFLVKLCQKLCRKDPSNPEFNNSHLKIFAAKVYGFAEVLAYEMLKPAPKPPQAIQEFTEYWWRAKEFRGMSQIE